MNLRIAKYPPIQGMGIDMHMVAPPSVPPPPPAPPNPVPIPSAPFAVAIGVPVAGLVATGKWAWSSVTTEYLGDILLGHDWGFGQFHLPMPPIVATPSIALLTLKSSIKYWLPSTPNKEPTDGSVAGGPNSVAVSLPTFSIPTEDCHDVSGFGFNVPSSVSMQLVSTRWVSFTFGDLVNGVINLVIDSAVSLVGSALGSKLGDSSADELACAVASAAVSVVSAQVVDNLVPAEHRDTVKPFLDAAGQIGAGGGLGGALTEGVKAVAGPMAGTLGEGAQGLFDGDRPPDAGFRPSSST
jgi:hypothetical protein